VDSAIAERLQAEAELQVAAALGPTPRAEVLTPELTPRAEPLNPELTREQLDFLRGRTWMRTADGKIVVLYSGTIRGKIPRGIICRPQTSAARDKLIEKQNKAPRQRRARRRAR
jgi:hypothetical protein